MSFVIVSNVSSSFGLKVLSSPVIETALVAWFGNPILNFASSNSIIAAVKNKIIADMTDPPMLIQDTQNVWYHCEGLDSYELNIVGIANKNQLDTHIFLFEGGTYIRQFSDTLSILERIEHKAFADYLNSRDLQTENIIQQLNQSAHSGIIKSDDFMIQYIYSLDPKTNNQLLDGPAYLQISATVPELS